MLRRSLLLACALLCCPLATRGDFTTTFENTGLTTSPASNNAGSSGAFTLDGNRFLNSYDPGSQLSYGWAISSQTDTTTNDYHNQFSAITGAGANGSSTYAVGFTYGTPASNQFGMPTNTPAYQSSNPFHPSDTFITLAAGMSARSIAITNTTYSYLTMRDGDLNGFSAKFQQGDYQLLDIRGYDATGRPVGVVDFYLADYRSTNSADWTLVNTWQTVDLAALAGATTLQFGIQSSQNETFYGYGVNIPAYFAADNFVFAPSVVPEPASLLLSTIGLGIGGLITRRPRNR